METEQGIYEPVHEILARSILHMGRDATKPVFGVSDIARLKPVSSATETSYQIDISLVSSLDMILYNKRITKVLISLH